MAKTLNDKVSPFLSYLQKRMDFIAQVATSPPSWCLLTDWDNLVNGFSDQYCLIKNIVRSHQGTEGGPDFEPLLEKKYERTKDHTLQLDVPHGEIGAQAFYTILENIVRNTAKYGDPTQLGKIKDITGDGKLRFTIAVEENWDDRRNGWTRDFYRIQIIDQLKNITARGLPNEEVVNKLNSFLAEYLTEPVTGVVKAKNWGMKEIKICAAYLRMVKQDQIDFKFEQWSSGTTAEPPIIEVSLEKLTPGSEAAVHLTYTLYLLRPKQALVVADTRPAEDEPFRRAGIDFWTLTEFLQTIRRGITPRHTFIVLPKPGRREEWDWLWKHLNFLPPRVLVRDCVEADIPSGRPQLSRTLAFLQGALPTNPVSLMEALWSNWVSRWWDRYRVFVRWSLHSDTIAERGEKEIWDNPAELDKGGWLVFDHRAAQDTSELFKAAVYHEGFGHGSATQRLISKRTERNTKSDVLANQTRLRIKEAAGLSVAVIDERVWLEKDGPASHGVRHYVATTSRINVWRKRRVFLQDANQAFDDFPNFVEHLDPPDIRIFDFIIIHQGILDSVKDKYRDSFDRSWKKLKNRARWVVIDSGRGQPEQAREDDLRWVEYSNLAECLVQYAGDKFRLAELLWTLRASAKNGHLT